MIASGHYPPSPSKAQCRRGAKSVLDSGPPPLPATLALLRGAFGIPAAGRQRTPARTARRILVRRALLAAAPERLLQQCRVAALEVFLVLLQPGYLPLEVLAQAPLGLSLRLPAHAGILEHQR